MTRKFLCLLVLLSCFARAESDTRSERMVELSRLWNFVKYLHPTVTSVDWDGALIRAIEKTDQAQSENEFRAVLADMLAELHDPATKLAGSPSPTAGATKEIPTLKVIEGVSVIKVRDADWSEAFQALRGMQEPLHSAKAIVVDIRDATQISELMSVSSKFVPLAQDIAGPKTAVRRHSGYPSPDGSGSGGYYSAFQYINGSDFRANTTGLSKTPFTVFLVNKKTSLPALAVAMQDSGTGAIVSEEPVGDEIAGASGTFEIKEGLSAEVRLEMLVHADGTTGLSANRVLQAQGEAALQEAIAIAKEGKIDAAPRKTGSSLPPPWKTDDAYANTPYPDREHRIMAAMRIYGVFSYFHPYKYLTGEDWDDVLRDALPQMEQAEDAREYYLAVAAMVTHAHDSHCTVRSKELSTVLGGESPAVQLLWVQDRAVVNRIFDTEEAKREGVEIGDVVLKINGDPAEKRIDELKRYKTASTPQALMQLGVMPALLAGEDGSTVRVTFEGKGGKTHEAVVLRSKANAAKAFDQGSTQERYRLLSKEIGYADLTKLDVTEVDGMFEAFKNTRSIIFDMRGYPLGTAWAIAPRLEEKSDPRKGPPVAAQFRTNIVSGIGEEGQYVTSELFEQRIPPSVSSRYAGKTAMLIDARAISQSEHSGLFYKAANGTVFIGSPTAGANGDVTWFNVPGGLTISFTGHDVRWPDGRQLQRIGLQPDVAVTPTIEGIRAGRDEVLEKAVEVMSKP